MHTSNTALVKLLAKATRPLGAVFPVAARAALFLVYGWFGLLKLVGESPATPLAEALTRRTLGAKAFPVAFAVLSLVECVIGLLALLPAYTSVLIPLLLAHMLIVCSPLVLVPRMAWTRPLVPDLEGQYIIKNAAIVALVAGLARL